MDKFEFEEERNILSVLNDQLSFYALTLPKLTDDVIDEYINGVIAGTVLVKGQIVDLVSNDGVNSLGSIPAVVTDIVRFNSTGIDYTLTLLVGDLNGELIPVKISNDKLTDAVKVNNDMTNIVTAIKSGKLGLETYLNIKANLNITRFYVFDETNTVFKSFM